MWETRAAHGGAMCEGLRWIARWSACCIVIVAVCVVSIGAGAQEQTASPTIRIAAAQNGRGIIDRLLEGGAQKGSLGLAGNFKNAHFRDDLEQPGDNEPAVLCFRHSDRPRRSEGANY